MPKSNEQVFREIELAAIQHTRNVFHSFDELTELKVQQAILLGYKMAMKDNLADLTKELANG